MNEDTKKKCPVFQKIMMIVMGIVTLASIILCVLITNFPTVVFVIHTCIFYVIMLNLFRNGSYAGLRTVSIVFPIVLCWNFFVLFLFFHFPVSSNQAWKYKALYEYTFYRESAPDFIPTEIPSSATEFHYEFLPSFLQGQGHISLEFRADQEYVDNLKKELEVRATDSFKISNIDAFNAKISAEDPNNPLRGYDMYWGDARTDHPYGTVYVLSSNYNIHHNRTSAIIIDGDYVFFSDY